VSCVTVRGGDPNKLLSRTPGVGMSADAARMSACATLEHVERRAWHWGGGLIGWSAHRLLLQLAGYWAAVYAGVSQVHFKL
jgi:hypothetical protein